MGVSKMAYTYIVVKLKIPDDIAGDREAIDDWLNGLEYDFQDLTNEDETNDPAYPGRVESEIVENQYNYKG